MNLKRCKNGHFYDVDKYPECPHCAGISGVDDSMGSTVAYDEGGVDGNGRNQSNTLGNTVSYSGNVTGFDDISVSDAFSDPAFRNTKDYNKGEKKSDKATLGGDLEDYIKNLDDTKDYLEDKDDIKTIRYNALSIDSDVEPVVGWLVCITGQNAGKSYVLKSGRNFIGRSSNMDVALIGDDKSISREKHAIILYEPRKREFLAQPGTSKELFYVNDDVVLNITKLNAYDKILIGKTELYFVPFCGEHFAWEDIAKDGE